MLTLEPTPRPYQAVNVISGCSHANVLPDLWISDPAQPLPQALTLSWDKPQTISSLQLVFDTDSDMNHPAGCPVETLVKAYQVQAVTDDGVRTVVQVADNRERFRVHHFEPVTTRAVTIHVEQVHAGGPEARLFEVRCS